MFWCLFTFSFIQRRFQSSSPFLGVGFYGTGVWWLATVRVAKHMPHFLCFNTSLIHQVHPPQPTKNEDNEIKSKKEREYFYSSFNSWSSSKGPNKSYCLQRKRWDTLAFGRSNPLWNAVSPPKIMCIHSHGLYIHTVLKTESFSCTISMLPAYYLFIACY